MSRIARLSPVAPALPRRRDLAGRGRARWAGGSAALLVALALTGCSSAGSSTSSVASAAPEPALAAPGAAPQDPAQRGPEGGAGTVPGSPADAGRQASGAGVTEPAEDKIVRTASIYLTVASIDTAAAAVRGVATGLGGRVASESVNATDRVPPPAPEPTPAGSVTAVARQGNYGQLVLAVPSDKLDAALDQLARLGTVVQRSAASRDVTAAYVDTESRIATKKASVERVRALMAGTQNIAQIVELEGQLAQREAELESLQATLAAMAAKVAMATVTVTIGTTAESVTPAPADAGFLAGLASGWRAFLAGLTVALTILGALLPWLVAAAILGLPVLAWWRRRVRARAVPAPAPAASLTPAREPALVGAGAGGPESGPATRPDPDGEPVGQSAEESR